MIAGGCELDGQLVLPYWYAASADKMLMIDGVRIGDAPIKGTPISTPNPGFAPSSPANVPGFNPGFAPSIPTAVPGFNTAGVDADASLPF